MQTLSGSYEQKPPLSLALASTSVDHSTVVTPSTFISSFTSEGISSTTHSGIASCNIRPSTPEITYPYPLYKSEHYYNRRRMMKPNQVRTKFYCQPNLLPLILCTYSLCLIHYAFVHLQVGMVYLHGVRIVSLGMEGKERLCLAQISNTLLKNYSYNEIHNRRVALGITCVQCTPVQVSAFTSSNNPIIKYFMLKSAVNIKSILKISLYKFSLKYCVALEQCQFLLEDVG